MRALNNISRVFQQKDYSEQFCLMEGLRIVIGGMQKISQIAAIKEIDHYCLTVSNNVFKLICIHFFSSLLVLKVIQNGFCIGKNFDHKEDKKIGSKRYN